MSTREQAVQILNQLTEEQLQGFILMFHDLVSVPVIPEEEPDAWDREMIVDSKEENTESMKLDDFVKELGLQPDDLRVRDSEKSDEVHSKAIRTATEADFKRCTVSV